MFDWLQELTDALAGGRESVLTIAGDNGGPWFFALDGEDLVVGQGERFAEMQGRILGQPFTFAEGVA